MAFENLTPDHALTEKDVVEVLKGGEDSRESLARRARYMAREARCGRDDLIESLMLSARNVREVLPSNRGMPHDRVFETAGELEWMEKERERRLRREMRDLCYAEQTISLIWDAYYRLDPEGRELLQEYYLDGEPAAAVAGKLDMSESTFWRKRKRSVNTILRFCERHSPTQHCG